MFCYCCRCFFYYYYYLFNGSFFKSQFETEKEIILNSCIYTIYLDSSKACKEHVHFPYHNGEGVLSFAVIFWMSRNAPPKPLVSAVVGGGALRDIQKIAVKETGGEGGGVGPLN